MAKETSPKIDPIPPFEINIDRDILFRVGTALGDCNIDELKTNEIRHVVELIAHLIFIEDLAPGLLRNMLSVLIPHYLSRLLGQGIRRRSFLLTGLPLTSRPSCPRRTRREQ